MRCARRVVVVADQQWRVVGLSSIARLDEVDVLVTDSGLDDGRSSWSVPGSRGWCSRTLVQLHREGPT